MAENGKIEPEKYGSLLQHSFSTLMDESDSDTISERSSNAPDLLDLRSKMKSPRSSIMSANPRNSETNGNYLNISNQKTDSISPRTSSSSESGKKSKSAFLRGFNYDPHFIQRMLCQRSMVI